MNVRRAPTLPSATPSRPATSTPILSRLSSGRCGEPTATRRSTRPTSSAARLQLGPGKRLLDVGTGRGWPGLYLAQQTGCHVIGTDLPVEGLEVARRRARDERIGQRVSLAVAGAADLP